MATESTQDVIKGLQTAKIEAEALLVFWKAASAEVSKTGAEMAKSFEGLNLKDFKDVAKLTSGLKEVNTLTEKQVAINKEAAATEKEKIALDKQLKNSTDEAVKGKLRLAAANKKQKDILKDSLILEDREAGTLTKLAASSRVLRREREGLNLETQKGKQRLEQINKALDKNNLKIDKNSDKLKKQKRNVGNYSASTKEAIQASGLFGRELAVLQRIQATLGIFMKKNTAETVANGTAQKVAAKSAGGFSKSLRVLKIALISTGVGAIVVALGALIAAFAGTQRGADAFTKAMRPLSAIFQQFIGFLEQTAFTSLDKLKEAFDNPKQAVKDLGTAIKDDLIDRFLGLVEVYKTGGIIIANGFRIMAAKIKLSLADVPLIGRAIDVKKNQKDLEEAQKNLEQNFHDLGNAAILASTGVANGLEKMSEAGDEMSVAMAKAVREGEQLDALIKKFERRQIDLVIPLAKARLEYQKLKEIANDQLKTDEQRIEALVKAEKVQRDISSKEGELLNLKIAAVELEQSFNDTSRAEELELVKLKAEKIKFEEQAQKKISGLVSLRTGIELRGLKRQQKAISDTEKQVDDLELRLNSNAFEVASIKALKSFEIEKKAIRDNELIEVDKQNELIVKLEIQLQIDLLKIESDRIKESQDNAIKDLEEITAFKKKVLKRIVLEGRANGETEEAIAEKVKDKKIELLKEEIEEKQKLGVDSLNEQIELSNLELSETDKKLKSEEELYKKSAEVIGEIFDKLYEKRNDAIDKDLKANEDAQDKIQKGIDAGNEDAKKSLGKLDREKAELEAKKERLRKQQLRTEAGIAIFKGYAENGGDLGKTIADTAVLTALISSLSFFDGTDETPDKVIFNDNQGGITGFVHKKEQVWSQKDRADVGFRSRDEIKDLVNRDLLTDPKQAIYMAQVDNSNLENQVAKMTESLQTLHERMPKQSYNYNAKSKEHEDIREFQNRKDITRTKATKGWA